MVALVFKICFFFFAKMRLSQSNKELLSFQRFFKSIGTSAHFFEASILMGLGSVDQDFSVCVDVVREKQISESLICKTYGFCLCFSETDFRAKWIVIKNLYFGAAKP